MKWTIRWRQEGEKTRRIRVDKKVEYEKTLRNISGYRIPPTCTHNYPDLTSLTTVECDKWGLDVISRDVMSSEPAVDDKRIALDASDTDDDNDCADLTICHISDERSDRQ